MKNPNHELPLNWPDPTEWLIEHRFYLPRRWRFDFANPRLKIAVEQEGGVWSFGRHTRGSGFVKDMEKYNMAVKLGWRVLRFTPQQIRSGEAARFVEEIING